MKEYTVSNLHLPTVVKLYGAGPNYHSHELKLLAVVQIVIEYRDFLLIKELIILTI